jgi:hypothetical protein
MKQPDSRNVNPEAKRAYKSPRLTSYGHLARLTNSGTSDMTEDVGMPSPMRRP